MVTAAPPNTRLKLAAPGLGKNSVCAPTYIMLACKLWRARGVGRRSLSAIR
jgi:hypothetical protein